MQPQAMIPQTALILVAGLLFSAVHAGPADDRQLAAELTGARHLQGELVELQAGEARFIAIHQPSRLDTTRGGVILLHDPWNRLDGERVIRPLRLGLAETGWETLSIQLPTAFASDSPQSWLARGAGAMDRVAAASRWLAGRGQRNQVLLGEGTSAKLLLRHVTPGTGQEIRGLILVSATVDAESPELESLATLKLPLLDVYAERDLPAVRNGLAARRIAAAGNDRGDYAQREITGAVAGYPRLPQALVATVRSWLAARADGRQLNPR